MINKSRQEELDKITPFLKRINPFIKEADWYKVGGWILKKYGYAQAIKNLPEININKLNIQKIDSNVFKYLTYHLNKLGWQKKAEYEKRRVEEDMKSLSEIINPKTVKLDPLWLQEARENYRRKKNILEHTQNPIEKRRIKIELNRMIEVVRARKENLIKGESN